MADTNASDRSRGRNRAERDPAERPVLPEVSRDDTDVGWGDADSRRDEEWYRRERPPHHE